MLTDVPPDPSWGLYQVITAVSFLHESCGSVHRLVSPFAVFVTVDGGQFLAAAASCSCQKSLRIYCSHILLSSLAVGHL